MAEPARKLEDKTEQPYLRSISGNGNTTSGRGDIHIYKPGENEEESSGTSKITDLAAARRAKGLNDLENNSDTLSANDSVSDRENNGSNITNISPESFVNNVQGKQDDSGDKGFKFKVQNLVKKKGPLATILATLGIGGIIGGSLLAPGTLLLNLRQTITDKLNTQTASLTVRARKILVSKTNSGACTTIKIACKYSSMSDRQLSRFNDAGITVNYGETTVTTKTTPVDADGNPIGDPITKTEVIDYNGSQTNGITSTIDTLEDNSKVIKEVTTEVAESRTAILGRVKPTSFEFEGSKITASEFGKNLSSNVAFSAAVNKAYNPLFASFADKFWNKTLFTLKIDENGVKISGGTSEEKAASVEAATKNELGTVDSNLPKESDYPDDPDGYQKALGDYNAGKTGDELINAADATSANKTAGELADAAQEASDSGTKTATKLFNIASEAGSTATDIAASAASTLKITGVIDNACSLYGSVRALGYAAKTVRAVQLASYAMLFLTIADQIKAGGNPDPADVSYLGSVLTTPSSTGKTATDGYGYKNDAYNEQGTMSNEESQFLAGAGLAGTLIFVTQFINNYLGRTPNTVCKINNNIFVQIGSFAVGVAAAAATVGTSVAANVTISAVAKGAVAIAVPMALMLLPSMLSDVVAGIAVDSGTLGDLSYAAIHTGAATTFNLSAANGGNTALNTAQALAYNDLSNQIAAEYAAEDRLAYSPLDASNSNTFMGKIVSYIAPYISDASSFSSALGSIASFTAGSLASITSSKYTYAASAAEYSVCQDLDYVNMGLAADPYCNLVYGVPTDSLENISPTEVLEKLASSGDINSDTGEVISRTSNHVSNILGQVHVSGQLSLSEYQTYCVGRTQPLGYTGDDFSGTDGSECLVSDQYPDNIYYSLYLIDKRAEDGMSGDDENLNVAMDSGLSSNIAFYNGSNGINIKNVASDSIFSKISAFFSNNNKSAVASDITATLNTSSLECALNNPTSSCTSSNFGFYKNQESSL